jgi:beta-lactam-binding protein with PASTA domain
MPEFTFDWPWKGETRRKTVRVSVPGTMAENAPLVVLLHGTGGDVDDMAEPGIHPGFNVQRVAEGTVVDRGWKGLPPIGWWSAGMDDKIDVEGWEPYLFRRGVPTINYAQDAAKGSLAESAAELRRLLELFEAQRTGQRHPAFMGVSHRRIVLMGHSRGGVLARQVLVDLRKAGAAVLSRISTCITLHAPNQGSNIANVAIAVDAAAADWHAKIDQLPVDWFLKERLRAPLDEFFAFVHEEAGAPVFPDYAVGSPVLAALAAAEPVPGIKYFTFGGTRSTLCNVRAWTYTPDSFIAQLNNPPFHWRTTYQTILPVPPPLPLEDPLPEVTPGRGDSCVAAAAARLPFSVHRDNPISHAEALWNGSLKAQVAAILDGLAPAASLDALELPVQLRSFNQPDRFMRHRNYLGELTAVEGPPEDFLFTIVRRGEGRVALRSVNFPASYLRHRDFRVRLEAPPFGGEALFEQDTTFHLERGIADPDNPQSVSFRSVNFPDHYLRHRNFELYLEPRNSPNLAADATFSRVEVPMQLRSMNYPDRFVRHRNQLGELTPKDASAEDFRFLIVPRGEGRVALRSVNFPDRCLRNRDFRIRLEGPNGNGDTLFEQDTTFLLERGRADTSNPQSVSLRSVNFPDRYLRHRDFELWLEPRTSANLAADATFYMVPAPTPPGSGATVPHVIGLPRVEADERIRAAQLQPSFTGAGDAAATVTAQSPAGGTTVPSASVVSVSFASTETTVPHVEGLRRADAEARVREAGLQPNATGSGDPAATVVTQTPVGSVKVPVASTVSFELAVVVAQATVPQVIGLSQPAADAKLRAAVLRPSFVGPVGPGAAVTTQTPQAGTRVPVESVVSVQLATVTATVPDVVGFAREAAVQAVVNAGLSATATRGDWVSRQAPTGGATVERGTTVALTLFVGEPL